MLPVMAFAICWPPPIFGLKQGSAALRASPRLERRDGREAQQRLRAYFDTYNSQRLHHTLDGASDCAAAEPMKEDEDQEMRQNASQCSTQWQIFPLIEPTSLSELPEPPLRAYRLKAFADCNVTDKQRAEIAGL